MSSPVSPSSTESPHRDDNRLAIVLSGGGARAAYQVGLLRCLARHRPEVTFDIVTGVSAGAINAAYLAGHIGGLPEVAHGLSQLWGHLTPERIFDTRGLSLGSKMMNWGLRLTSGGKLKSDKLPQPRGMVDTRPLGKLLERELSTRNGVLVGIGDNISRGRLKAFALTTLDYGTGRTITWTQGDDIEEWHRPNRRSMRCEVTVNHVLASAALPLFFPAVQIGDSYHGDGGVRLAAPLSPALHLGAARLLVLSTRYRRSDAEADEPSVAGYPPPAQILGHLMNAIFLDLIDQDLLRVERINRLLLKLPPEERDGLRPVHILALRPSEDLGKLASAYEPQLPGAFRFLTRGLGTRETRSPDFLSLLMFQPDYLKRLMEIGEKDAEARMPEIEALLDGHGTYDDPQV